MEVGQNINTKVGSWNFGDSVPDNFVEHAKMSIPMYSQGHELILDLSEFFVKEESITYEIGVSTGELIRKLSRLSKHLGVPIKK